MDSLLGIYGYGLCANTAAGILMQALPPSFVLNGPKEMANGEGLAMFPAGKVLPPHPTPAIEDTMAGSRARAHKAVQC